jgi:hypothetical protein
MGALLGFAVGYYVGTREGPNSIPRMLEAWQYISKSDEFKGLASQAVTLGGGLLKQGLSSRGGSVYPALAEGVVDLLARRRAA